MSDNGDDITWAFVGLGFGVYSFFRGFRVLRNKRIVENTPTSKCRSIAMGLVEVQGTAAGERTIPSLVGQLPCFCSQVKIERWQKSGKSHRWVKVHEEKTGIPFLLEDSTGRVKVDPAGAEYDLSSDLEYSTSGGLSPVTGLTLSRLNAAGAAGPMVAQRFQSYCAAHGVSFQGKMRFFERNLCPGDPVYVLGTAGEVPGVADEYERVIIQKGRHHPWFFIAESSERELLAKMSRQTWLGIFGGAALSLACLGYLLYKFGRMG
jgi:hypothetical protein